MDKSEESFSKLLDIMAKEEREVLKLKGSDYSDAKGGNRLSNFERLSKRLDSTPEKILAVYLMKHIDAILTYCKDGQVSSEGIEGRILDARNYLALLRLMIESSKKDA